MGIFYDAAVDPVALTTFVRAVPMPSELTLLNSFPARTTPDNTFDYLTITTTNGSAKFRSWDAALPTSARDVATESRGRLIPLSDSVNKGELERLQIQFAQMHGQNHAAMEQVIYDDAARLTQRMYRRMELAWGDVLTDGKLTINENSLVTEADFTGGLTITTTAGTLWSNLAASTPLTDLIAWCDAYKATNGFMPGSWQTSLRVMRLIQTNAEIIAAVHGTLQGKSRVTLDELGALLASEGLPQPRPAYDTVIDVDGVSTRPVADDKVVFLPPNVADLGYTMWGMSATALEIVRSNAADLAFADGPGIVGAVIKSDEPPFREFTFTDAVAIPVLANARLLYVADVA